jgi:hypothetical protein
MKSLSRALLGYPGRHFGLASNYRKYMDGDPQKQEVSSPDDCVLTGESAALADNDRGWDILPASCHAHSFYTFIPLTDPFKSTVDGPQQNPSGLCDPFNPLV